MKYITIEDLPDWVINNIQDDKTLADCIKRLNITNFPCTKYLT